MTIKQAFEKLTAVTAAAMKNPFFVMRKLHDAFADIADKVEGGGGGSTVEVTQVVSTGTKIATITVDDTPTDLYAPASSSQDYSTTPRIIGKWIDGTADVYEVTYDVNNLTFSGQSCTIDANFTDKLVISYTGAVTAAGGSANTSLNGIPGIDNWEFGVHLASPALLLYAGTNAAVTTLTGGHLILIVRYLEITT